MLIKGQHLIISPKVMIMNSIKSSLSYNFIFQVTLILFQQEQEWPMLQLSLEQKHSIPWNVRN